MCWSGKRAAAVAHAVPEVGALPAFAERFGAWARRHASRGVEADALGFLRSLPPIDRTLDACLAVARRPAGRAHLRIWRNPEAPVVAARLGPWRITRAL
jgi:hypothetical protein